ncbi:terminase small subunit [Planococcus beigongshangi]|uniref:terminase small subunit n=1 Tax=Planococcus beigongshangi TaxID=2782536 RepID=UPI00193B37A1|nr:terminase small subunit [Planococcus beigongshangi]
MARKRDPRRDEAFQIWKQHEGKVTNRAIAEQLDVPEKTIGGWKSKDKWNGESNGVLQSKIRSTPKEKKKKEVFVESDKLNDKQRLFCIYYIKYFNATKAYQKAYEVDRNTAESIAYRLMGNDGVKSEIRRLKEQRLSEAYFDKYDVLQKYKDIAFADITDFIDFTQVTGEVTEKTTEFHDDGTRKSEKTETVPYTYTKFTMHHSDKVDGTLISEIARGKDGMFKVKLADKMKALEMLAKYTDLLSDNDKKRLQEEKIKVDTAKAKAEAERISKDHNEDVEEIVIVDAWSDGHA